MIDLVFLGLVIFAAVYWLVALTAVVRYRQRRPSTSDVAPPVTMLKPLRDNDGQLYENLRSFCLQDYRSFEIVFGVRDVHDPAVAVVERLRQEFPGLELKLVADSRTIGTNLKVSSLANLVRHAKHDTLIVADSDMRVGPGYVRAVVGPLEDRRVGLVTCLYRGVASHGVASKLGAMFINDSFAIGGPAGQRHLWGATQLGSHVSVGTNATLLPVSICDHVVIGAGAVVTKDLKEPGIYAGNPARLLRRFNSMKEGQP